jgi:hypothetical protein
VAGNLIIRTGQLPLWTGRDVHRKPRGSANRGALQAKWKGSDGGRKSTTDQTRPAGPRGAQGRPERARESQRGHQRGPDGGSEALRREWQQRSD